MILPFSNHLVSAQEVSLTFPQCDMQRTLLQRNMHVGEDDGQ